MLPFGPRLIGQTEKTLDAVLAKILIEPDLSTSEWVTLQLAAGNSDDRPLALIVRDQAHLEDAEDVIGRLDARGLLSEDQLSEKGRNLVARVLESIAALTGSIWENLDQGDVAAAERVLDAVHSEYRALLARLG